MKGFSVHYRNFGHWDIYQDQGRIFRIRGGPGAYQVIDERDQDNGYSGHKDFKTVGACMTYISDELMFELIIADGQTPTVIEDWNVSVKATSFGAKQPQ